MLAPANETDWVHPEFSKAIFQFCLAFNFAFLKVERNFGQNMRKDEAPKTDLKMGWSS